MAFGRTGTHHAQVREESDQNAIKRKGVRTWVVENGQTGFK